MAKRHQFSDDLPSRIRRAQELIMAHSGVDEFYEIIRLILAKYFAEIEGVSDMPSMALCNEMLKKHASEVSFILDTVLDLQTPDSIFDEVRRVFDGINIRAQDFSALDSAFEQLTSRTYKSDKGQFFTPRHVVDMCVEAIDPKPGQLICDPACGSAAFLKSAHTYSLEKYGKSSSLFGFDYSHRACQVARVVSLIGANKEIKIHQLDSLNFGRWATQDASGDSIEKTMGDGFTGFDAIITNPPFAGDVSSEPFAQNYDLARLYPQRLERDLLFIERCIRLLKNGGKLAIVLPDNKISSRVFSDVRQWLSKQALINAVVSLHRYTFLPYTSQKAAVIFATRMPSSLSSYECKVGFFRSDKAGKTSNGSLQLRKGANQNMPAYAALDHDLGEIAQEIKGMLCAS